MMGWLILNDLVKGVEKTGSEEGIAGEEVGEGWRDKLTVRSLSVRHHAWESDA